jgi:hypothetical protein
MVLFDTLAYAKALEEGGVDKQLAETHARALLKLVNKFNQYKNANQPNPDNRTQSQKNLIAAVLDYTKELIEADEKPKVSLIMAETMVKHLLN